ncbi:type I-E CRISPR-associated protein Cas5/CasD [Nocardiopsis sp. CNT-189]|uniref:type I-E CRISPR-associated protein Cas5/CasD n=1 Tax=Nocardiopsis oceanisediminis TaxID=2816862 RepID=UPI003B398CAB
MAEQVDVLALRLGGPLQSWGGGTRFTTRGTLSHPTKSGVVGLCAAALGRPRGADLSDLAALEFGVRTDRPGELLIDYHTMSAASHGPLAPKEQRLPTADGKMLKPGEGKISRRYYLQDAVFTAAFAGRTDGQRDLLRRLEEALRRPRYPLFLGRRSCPPDRPVLIARFEGAAGAHRALSSLIPWQVPKWRRVRRREAPERLAVAFDHPEGEELIDDLPAGGAAFDRVFAHRPVRHDHIEPGRLPVGPEGSGPPQEEEDEPPLFDGEAALGLLPALNEEV